jgi:hypothetical protein
MHMPSTPKADSRPRRTQSLWSIVESLQRRLEHQGLTRDVVDVAVVNALTAAMRGGRA